jgi:hypothetical protein
MNPFDGIAKFALGLIEKKILQAWVRLLFSMLGSGALTFMLVCGGSLIGVKTLVLIFGPGVAAALPTSLPAGDWGFSLGLGMVISALMMVVVFRRDPLSKGIMLVLPSWEAAAELATDIQVIDKTQEKKS